MKTQIFSALILGALAFCSTSALTAQVVVDFEDVGLTTENSFLEMPFESGGVAFNGRVAEFDIYEGFVASNATVNQDLAISPGSLFGQPEFALNQFSAYVPDAGAPSDYAVLVFNNSDAPRTASVGTILAPVGTQFDSIDVTNTTFAAHSILVGDGFSDPFEDDDALTLFIEGRRDGVSTGEVEFSLADGRDVVDEFTTISLATLGGADEIAFSLSSTSSGPFGLNTPTFIAIDDVTFATVPEPSSLVILGLGALTAVLRRRKS